jgi:TM2 domain-containing membrane protein YozV
LALFLGWLGIHRFYLGRWTTGSIMLAIWMLRWVLLRIGSMIGWMSFNRALTFATFIDGAAKARDLVIIWALIDFVLILTGRLKDGQGYGLG